MAVFLCSANGISTPAQTQTQFPNLSAGTMSSPADQSLCSGKSELWSEPEAVQCTHETYTPYDGILGLGYSNFTIGGIIAFFDNLKK